MTSVPVTHVLDTGFDVSEVHPGVFVVDGLGAVLADSLAAQSVRVMAVDTSDVFDVSPDVLVDARRMRENIVKRRKLLG